jgi:hypothetical protein
LPLSVQYEESRREKERGNWKITNMIIKKGELAEPSTS